MSDEYKGQKVLFKAHSIHLMNGLDLLGSKMSLNAGRAGAELLVLEHGVVAVSKGTGRHVYIPNANIKGADITEGLVTTRAAKTAQAQAEQKAKVAAKQAPVEPKAPPAAKTK